jgi:ubiquitin carboxyl-terminal hydrolase L3
MTKLPEAHLPQDASITIDDPDVPKTRKAFVPLGSYTIGFLDIL